MGSDELGQAIDGIGQLADYLASGERHVDTFKVGTEYEKLAVHRDTGAPLPFRGAGGEPGILDLLTHLQSRHGMASMEDAGELIGLQADDASLTLEPGGQFELSGGAYERIAETHRELEAHLDDLRWLSSILPVSWLWTGARPHHGLDSVPWMPKRRYGVMRGYLPTRGAFALHMMKQTCTVQANLDFRDEADMGDKLRVSMGIGSMVTAMFANSPLAEGRPCGYKSYRAHIWSDVDPDRSGLLPWVFEGDAPTYEQYVRYVLAMPMFFIVREGEYLPCPGLPFETFLRDGLDGNRATLADWELHLSTAFPDTRLKTYLEVRTADCVVPSLICALPALWKGILYDGTARAAAWDLVKRWPMGGRWEHRAAVARDALEARTPCGHRTADLAVELLDIAAHGLAGASDGEGGDERAYLRPLEALTRTGRAPADRTLAWLDAAPRSAADVRAHYGDDLAGVVD